MFNVNEVRLSGNLTRDAEAKEIGKNIVAKFSIGHNKSYKDKAGEWVSKPHYLDVDWWMDKEYSSNVMNRLTKGAKVLVYGELEQQRWEKDGQTNQKVQIRANKVQFAERANGSGDNGSGKKKKDFDF